MAMLRLREIRHNLIKRILDVRISTKIIGPFVAMALIISLSGGLITNSWLTSRLEESAKDHLELGRANADAAFAHMEIDIMNYAKAMSITPNLPNQLQTKDLSQIRQELIPQMITFDLDFFEIIDEQARVILNNNGPYADTSNLSKLSMLQSAQVEMTIVDLIETSSGTIISAIAPVKHAGGKVGFVMTGYYVSPKLLENIKKISGHDISLFTQKGLVATSSERRPEAACQNSGCHSASYTALISRKILKGEGTGPEYADMLGEPYLISHSSLKLHGEPVAFYSALMPMKDVVRAQNIATYSIILLSILVMALIIIIGYVVAKTLSNPLKNLSAMTKKVTDGDLTPRSEYDRKDEIGELASSFNQMTESLQNYTDNLKQRVQELSILYETGLAVTSTFDLDTLLKAVLDNIVKVFDVDYGSITLSDIQTQKLTTKAVYTPHQDAVKKTWLKIGETIVGWVVKNKRPLLLNKNDSDEQFRSLLSEETLTYAICVPLTIQDAIIGAISIGRGETKSPFTQNDLNFLMRLATQAAVVIKNVELYCTLRKSYLSKSVDQWLTSLIARISVR
ncbi:MAG: GAF domain-containing protein [Actinomycetota bacterium]